MNSFYFFISFCYRIVEPIVYLTKNLVICLLLIILFCVSFRIERRSPQPVPSQMFYARREREGRRVDRGRSRVLQAPPPTIVHWVCWRVLAHSPPHTLLYANSTHDTHLFIHCTYKLHDRFTLVSRHPFWFIGRKHVYVEGVEMFIWLCWTCLINWYVKLQQSWT